MKRLWSKIIALATLFAFTVSLPCAQAADSLRPKALSESKSGLEELEEELDPSFVSRQTGRFWQVAEIVPSASLLFGFFLGLMVEGSHKAVPAPVVQPPVREAPTVPGPGAAEAAGEAEMILYDLDSDAFLEELDACLGKIEEATAPGERPQILVFPRPWTLQDLQEYLETHTDDPDRGTLYPLLYRSDPRLFKEKEARKALLRLVGRMQKAVKEDLLGLRRRHAGLAQTAWRIHWPDAPAALALLKGELMSRAALNELYLEEGQPAPRALSRVRRLLEEAARIRASLPDPAAEAVRQVEASAAEEEKSGKPQKIHVLADKTLLQEREPSKEKKIQGAVKGSLGSGTDLFRPAPDLVLLHLVDILKGRPELAAGYRSFSHGMKDAPSFEEWLLKILAQVRRGKLAGLIDEIGKEWRGYLRNFENTPLGPDKEDADQVFSDFVLRQMKLHRAGLLPPRALKEFERFLEHLEQLERENRRLPNPDDEGIELYADAGHSRPLKHLPRDISLAARSRSAGLEEGGDSAAPGMDRRGFLRLTKEKAKEAALATTAASLLVALDNSAEEAPATPQPEPWKEEGSWVIWYLGKHSEVKFYQGMAEWLEPLAQAAAKEPDTVVACLLESAPPSLETVRVVTDKFRGMTMMGGQARVVGPFDTTLVDRLKGEKGLALLEDPKVQENLKGSLDILDDRLLIFFGFAHDGSSDPDKKPVFDLKKKYPNLQLIQEPDNQEAFLISLKSDLAIEAAFEAMFEGPAMEADLFYQRLVQHFRTHEESVIRLRNKIVAEGESQFLEKEIKAGKRVLQVIGFGAGHREMVGQVRYPKGVQHRVIRSSEMGGITASIRSLQQAFAGYPDGKPLSQIQKKALDTYVISLGLFQAGLMALYEKKKEDGPGGQAVQLLESLENLHSRETALVLKAIRKRWQEDLSPEVRELIGDKWGLRVELLGRVTSRVFLELLEKRSFRKKLPEGFRETLIEAAQELSPLDAKELIESIEMEIRRRKAKGENSLLPPVKSPLGFYRSTAPFPWARPSDEKLIADLAKAEPVDQKMGFLAAGIVPPGQVVVVGEGVIRNRVGLEEFLIQQGEVPVIFFEKGSDLTNLALQVMAQPKMRRVLMVGLEEEAELLRRILPGSFSVVSLAGKSGLEEILLALGALPDVLDQIDAAGMEEALAAERGA